MSKIFYMDEAFAAHDARLDEEVPCWGFSNGRQLLDQTQKKQAVTHPRMQSRSTVGMLEEDKNATTASDKT